MADVSRGELVNRISGCGVPANTASTYDRLVMPTARLLCFQRQRGRQAAVNVGRGVKRRAFGVVRSSKYRTPSAAASDTTSAVMRVIIS